MGIVCFEGVHLTYHLSDPVEAFAVELECLLEQDLVFDAPVVGVGREVWEVDESLLDVVLVPKQHS